MGKYGKKNEIKIDPLKYNILLLGEPKIGKTTIIKEFLEKLAGSESYIFLEMSGEAGADAINGIIFEDCDSWDDVEDIVSDIEDYKTTDYPELRAIVIDTYDGWIKLAQEQAIKLWNKTHRDKEADSIDASWNGFQKGQQKAFDFMFDIICRLRKVGVATIVIGHVKNKENTDIATGVTYSTLTSDVEKIYFNLLKKKMHFMGLAYYDRTIITEKTGKKNIVTKKNETINKIKSESRKIKFRDDNMALDSGSRFSDIIDTIDFDVDQLIDAITDAIKSEASKGSKSIEQLKREQEVKAAEKMKEVAEKEEYNKEQKAVEPLIAEVLAFVKANIKTKSKYQPILDLAKEFGYSNPAECRKLEEAEKLHALIK